MPNKIFAGPAEVTGPITVEALASAAILPGQLVVRTAGEFAVSGATGELLVALEYGAHVGMGGVNVAYAIDDLVIAAAPRSGEFYWVRAAAATYAAGALLEKAATGRVAALASGVAQFVVEQGATVTAGQLLLVRKL